MALREIKKMIVTGGGGFIGSNFLNYMVPKYPNIHFYNIDCLNYASNLNNILVSKNPNYTFIYKKLQEDHLFLYNFLIEHDIDCIIHFAAQSHVDTSFVDSLVFTDDNVVATHVLLEMARQYHLKTSKLKLMIHISTDEVYGDTEFCCKNESSRLNPTNPYAASKAAAEMLCTSYIHSFKMPIIITRSNNIYGPGQYDEKLIPKFINLLLNDNPCTIHGDGNYFRYFIHVLDICKAFELLIEKGYIGEIYNIGSEEGYTVNEIADFLIHEIKGLNVDITQWKVTSPDRIFNDTRYLINYDKIKSLGWKPTISFENGIINTIQWYNKQLI